jgi:hypothetical protein
MIPTDISEQIFSDLLVQFRQRYRNKPIGSISLIAALTAAAQEHCLKHRGRGMTEGEFLRLIHVMAAKEAVE